MHDDDFHPSGLTSLRFCNCTFHASAWQHDELMTEAGGWQGAKVAPSFSHRPDQGRLPASCHA
jgi:hypothetical protein